MRPSKQRQILKKEKVETKQLGNYSEGENQKNSWIIFLDR